MSEEGNALVGMFEGERQAADDARKVFETMWIDCYRMYYSEYGPETKIRPGGSTVYYGLARQKTKTACDRQLDILFNRAGLPFNIEPTPEPNVPVQQVVDYIYEQMPPDLQQQVMAQGPEAMMQMLPPESFKDAEKAIAREAAKKMKTVIEDQWREDKATLKIKQAILEKCITGTCVLKFGTTEREVPSWVADDTEGKYQYQKLTKYVPTVKHVSIFDVWFDPHAKLQVDNGTIESCDYVYERHVLTHAQLLDLMEKPAFIREAIVDILREGPDHVDNISDTEMRTIWGSSYEPHRAGYDVYERTGYLTVKQLREGGIEAEGEDYEIFNMNIWYCSGKIIKAIKVPYKGVKLPYFVVPQELAPGQLYGLGIPYKMRHSQTLLNSAIRLFIDNKANAAGPIIFIDEDAWESSSNPEEELVPWGMPKIQVPQGKRMADILEFKIIPDVSEQLRSLIELAKHQADEESGIPAFSHAAQSPELTKATGGTASGMSMIMGAADLAHKAAVRNIDDFLLTPLLESFYHWNMQFNDDDTIKGDMKVMALGTIGVLRKELQSQRLTQLITQTANPVDAELFPRDELWYDIADSLDLDVDRYRKIAEKRKEQKAQQQAMMAQQQAQQAQQQGMRANPQMQVISGGGGGA